MDPAYLENRLDVFKTIIEVVAKDYTTDAVKELATLNQSASTCVCSNTETLGAFIESISIPAQAYLNYGSTDKSSAVSLNLAMTLISDANPSHELFSTLMSNLMSSRKHSTDENHPTIPINVTRVGKLISTFFFSGRR